MYIKKILLFISITGLVILSIFSYFVYVTMFVSNTNFNNEIAYVYVYTDQTFEELKQDWIKFDGKYKNELLLQLICT